jgi:hypothetical protein
MTLTNFPNGLSSFGVPVLPGIPIPFTGNYYFVDPVNGADGNAGTDPSLPLQSLYMAHYLCRSGKNDVVFLIGNGAASGTSRLSLANAQTVAAATGQAVPSSGTLVWSKNACHLIGITAPTGVSPRARIAPPTGTYTAATFGSNTMVSVTGQGCYFSNFQAYQEFSTGNAAEICWSDTGGRNVYNGVHFAGIVDAAALAGTAARSLVISGTTGENLFTNCTIGNDTTARSVANASLEFAAGTPRNKFVNCQFPFMTSAAGVLGIITSAAASMDRWQLFDGCMFMNAVNSTSTTMTALCSLTAASGGYLIFQNSTMAGISDFGAGATEEGQIFIMGPVPTDNTTGIAIRPV